MEDINTSVYGLVENVSFSDNMTTSIIDSSGESGIDYYQLAEDVFVVVDPILTAVGVLGNLLTFLVMQGKSLRSSPTAVYLSALSLADTFVLCLDFLNNWLKMKPKIYLLGDTAFCIFHRFFFNVCYTYASWLVASVAVERFVVVWFPLRAKSLCTTKSALISVVVQPIVLCVLYSYNFWGWGINEDAQCDAHERMAFFINYVSPWLTAVLYSYFPIIVITFCNVGIIIKLVGARGPFH